MKAPAQANYGIDAPVALRRLFLAGTMGLAGGILLLRAGRPQWGAPLLSMGLPMFLTACVMVWGSKVGKLRLRDRVLASIPWRGDEAVLDVGCGHGLMLIGAARRLTTGKAVGVDIWQSEDQAGNRPEATRANAEREGVTARGEICDGDARALPFPGRCFDVVASSFAVHNIYDSAGRAQALREIVRVLKPAGCLILIDIRHTADYARVLEQCGMKEVKRSRPYFLFVNPALLTAFKP